MVKKGKMYVEHIRALFFGKKNPIKPMISLIKTMETPPLIAPSIPKLSSGLLNFLMVAKTRVNPEYSEPPIEVGTYEIIKIIYD